jgi:hypothetical protein
VEEGRVVDHGYLLVLQSPAEEQVRIEAASRPRAYMRAIHVAATWPAKR